MAAGRPRTSGRPSKPSTFVIVFVRHPKSRTLYRHSATPQSAIRPILITCYSAAGALFFSAIPRRTCGKLKDALIKSFDRLKTNGNVLIPFVVSLSSHERNPLVQSFLK
jgi:hypothetical protein